MTDDIVTRLRDRVAARPEFVPEGSVGHLIYEAADEIERLRKALDLAVGELSTKDRYRLWNPEQLRQQLLDEAVRSGL